MSRPRRIAGRGRRSQGGEWLKAPQRCLAAKLGSRDGKGDCEVRSSIVHGGVGVPVWLRGGQLSARSGRGAEALLWPEPVEWDAESNFTAWSGGDGLDCDESCGKRPGAARCGTARQNDSKRLLGDVGTVVLRKWEGRSA